VRARVYFRIVMIAGDVAIVFGRLHRLSASLLLGT
jgi:hypothetical protein